MSGRRVRKILQNKSPQKLPISLAHLLNVDLHRESNSRKVHTYNDTKVYTHVLHLALESKFIILKKNFYTSMNQKSEFLKSFTRIKEVNFSLRNRMYG